MATESLQEVNLRGLFRAHVRPPWGSQNLGQTLGEGGEICLGNEDNQPVKSEN